MYRNRLLGLGAALGVLSIGAASAPVIATGPDYPTGPGARPSHRPSPPYTPKRPSTEADYAAINRAAFERRRKAAKRASAYRKSEANYHPIAQACAERLAGA